ncbi:MAG: DUF1566 domain-containing protein [Desulfocapsaceae bacterium]|nr:DUF1566 domain-containing protein [Desulfocapsaceae bacterium]
MRTSLTLIFILSSLAIVPGVSGQTCNTTSITATIPDSQLTDNGDGTITDSKTGLMWKKCMEGVTGNLCDTGVATTFTWQTALQQPGVVNGGGFATHQDWRLPNIKELTSIVEEQCYDPSINLNRFPNTPSSVVWSGSPFAYYSDSAWVVNFYYGSSFNGDRSYGDQVRLVRGGQ